MANTRKTRVVRTLDERITDTEALLVELKAKKEFRDRKETEKARREAEKEISYSDPDQAKALQKERRKLEKAVQTLQDSGLGDSPAVEELKAKAAAAEEALQDLVE
ncbi:MAG: hypothetical protein E4G90_10590 [Gemmatimonadales bacterium]|nr:MAG: hypothetical protein E4G90_10590 [Gemmatimonadales bacterium]